MNILVVTTFNNKLEEAYAHRFRDTYNWPFELKIYNEDLGMYVQIPKLKEFVDRNKDRHKFTSYEEKNNDFRKDGVRFSYKVYAYTEAILQASNAINGIICIDADSVFYKPIDVHFIIDKIHRDDCMMSYLGRHGLHSECGFLYFNLNHPFCKTYAKAMQELYDTDRVYDLKECHDSYVWDYVRIFFEQNYGVKNFNITKEQEVECLYHQAHVQAISCLAPYYDHCKGDRKEQGRSPENNKL